MRVFLAGATGAIGRPLLARLRTAGHEVVAMTHNPSKVPQLQSAGAQPVIADGLDREAVLRAVDRARPDAIIHQMTSIGKFQSFRKLDRIFAQTNRLRTLGTDHLLEAAQRNGVGQFIAQSYAGWPNAREGGRVKTEDDPLDPDPPAAMKQTLAAIRHLERTVTQAGGTVLRYGGFYGPGTSLAPGGDALQAVRRRLYPVAGSGAGVWSFLHIHDAADATLNALEQNARGLFNIVDDEPAEVALWLPYLAQTIGAPPPRHLPGWLARILLGEAGMSMMTQARGSSNAKARQLLRWRPAHATWREGFREFARIESR